MMKISKQNTRTILVILRSIVASRVMMLLKQKTVGERRIQYLKKYNRQMTEAYQRDLEELEPKFKKGRIEYCFAYRFSIELLKSFWQSAIIGGKSSFVVNYTSLFNHSIMSPSEYRLVLLEISMDLLNDCHFSSYKEVWESPYPHDTERLNKFVFSITL